jgi:hypothetical protein
MMDAQDKARLRQKNGKVIAALAQAGHGPGSGRFSVRTRFGEVEIQSIRTATDSAGVEFLEVYLAGQPENGDPHWRIYNPPTAVIDPQGDITGNGGRRLREDPILAVAEAIAGRGGRQKGRKP